MKKVIKNVGKIVNAPIRPVATVADETSKVINKGIKVLFGK